MLIIANKLYVGGFLTCDRVVENKNNQYKTCGWKPSFTLKQLEVAIVEHGMSGKYY